MTECSDSIKRAKELKVSVSIASLIGETLPLQRAGRHLLALCPFHHERTPSFCVYSDHYHCFGCGAHGDVFSWVMARHRLSFPTAVEYLSAYTCSDRRPHQKRGHARAAQRTRGSNLQLALRCWKEGIDPAGTLVAAYLGSRGLTIPADAPIRFHPHCQRGSRDWPGGPEFWPAMLALMTDPVTAEPVGVHRTYLLRDGSGKAPVSKGEGGGLRPKMILGTWGMIRLSTEEFGRGLAVAEGIENALTAMQVIGWGPVWSAGTKDGVRTLPVLPFEAVTIFADRGTGLDAARTCAKRWAAAGREAIIHVPPEGTDWNLAMQRFAA